jgi:hypothetical protein
MSLLDRELAARLVEFALGHGVPAKTHAALLGFLHFAPELSQIRGTISASTTGALTLTLTYYDADDADQAVPRRVAPVKRRK